MRREYWFGVGVVGGASAPVRSCGYVYDRLVCTEACTEACTDGWPDVGRVGHMCGIGSVNIDIFGNSIAGSGKLRPEVGEAGLVDVRSHTSKLTCVR